jgi:hypothetical protein
MNWSRQERSVSEDYLDDPITTHSAQINYTLSLHWKAPMPGNFQVPLLSG